MHVADSTIGRHLHRLGWTLVRPVLTVQSRDPAYASKADELEQLKERAKRGEITLLFEDELDLNLLPGVLRCWTRVGEQRKIPTPGINQKRYGFGAVNFLTGEVVSHLAERKNSTNFCTLVEAIVSRFCPGAIWTGPKVVLVLDNYIIHQSKLTQETLTKYMDRLEVFHLPTYSPKLNVIELLWKYLRATVTHNHLFASIDELVAAVHQFFADLANDPTTVLSIIGAQPEPQPVDSPQNLCSAI